MDYDFYISYSRKNFKEANFIVNQLNTYFNIFHDAADINIGSNWLVKIKKAFPRSSNVIVYRTPDYVHPTYVNMNIHTVT